MQPNQAMLSLTAGNRGGVKLRWLVPFLFGWLALVAPPASAETLRFQVRLIGAPVGEMVLASNADGRAYAAKGVFQTTGLAGLLARVRFEMSARGAGALPDLRSRHYAEDLDTGFRASSVDLAFASSERRIDPLTAILAALDDRPAGASCGFDRRTWDGVRSMRILIDGGSDAGKGMVCNGLLTRLTGYTAAEMAEAVHFPFTVTFEPRGSVLVAVRADIRTIHGRVALVRR